MFILSLLTLAGSVLLSWALKPRGILEAERFTRYLLMLEDPRDVADIQKAFPVAARRFLTFYYTSAHFVFTFGEIARLLYSKQTGYLWVISSATSAAMLFQIYFPVVPPRLLYQLPGPALVTIEDDVGLLRGFWSWDQVKFSNSYAAFPSVHVLWALWVAKNWGIYGKIHNYLTIISVITTGNHYFIDVLGSYVLYLVTYWCFLVFIA